MAATKQDIRQWLKQAPKGATHMAVVCDTYDWDDYPVYVMKGQDVQEKIASYARGDNMQRLMEVYNLAMDHEKQLAANRVMNC